MLQSSADQERTGLPVATECPSGLFCLWLYHLPGPQDLLLDPVLTINKPGEAKDHGGSLTKNKTRKWPPSIGQDSGTCLHTTEGKAGKRAQMEKNVGFDDIQHYLCHEIMEENFMKRKKINPDFDKNRHMHLYLSHCQQPCFLRIN